MRSILLALSLLFTSPAFAGLTERDLAGVSLSPPAGARIPPTLRFHDDAGRSLTVAEALADRPALLLPVDYTCRSICGPALSIVSRALAETGLMPGGDFHLLVVGIDPKDDPESARAAVDARIADGTVSRATRILAGDAASTRAFLDAIGYRAVYDAQADQFAHPAGALALTADGRVARALSSLGLQSADLRLALVEAGEGRIGGVLDRLTLRCYGYDALHGIYAPLVRRMLTAAGLATLLGLAAMLILFGRLGRRRAEAP